MAAKNFRETRVYKLAFEMAMERSDCANIAEAYGKKRYRAHFISKASDADTENSETGVWLEFSVACNYIGQEKFKALLDKNQETGKLLGHMINNPDKY